MYCLLRLQIISGGYTYQAIIRGSDQCVNDRHPCIHVQWSVA